MHGPPQFCKLDPNNIGSSKIEKPKEIDRENSSDSIAVKKCSLEKYVHRQYRHVLFGSDENRVCKVRPAVLKAEITDVDIFEETENILDSLENVESFSELGDLKENIDKVLNFISDQRSQLNVRSPFGRKLLSIDDKCDSEDCSGDRIVESDYEDDEEDPDGNEDPEDYEDFDEDEFLLDEDQIYDMLHNTDDSEKISILNNLLEKLEVILKSNDDPDLYVSAIQSLIAYISFIEELNNEALTKGNTEMEKLERWVKLLKMTYLSQITHFEIFYENSIGNFSILMEMESLDKRDKNTVQTLNNFVFNFHYASEIQNIIRKRDIADELEFIEDVAEDMKLMKRAYETLGFGEEFQDESYFSRMLEDVDEEDIHQTRKLLSISQDNDIEVINGHCDSDTHECDDKDDGGVQYLGEKDAGPTPDNVKACEQMLDRARDILKINNFESRQFTELDKSGKIAYLRTYLKRKKSSEEILNDYRDIRKNTGNPTIESPCENSLKTLMETLRSKSADDKSWLEHISSFLTQLDAEDEELQQLELNELLELSEVLAKSVVQAEGEGEGENVGSVDKNEFCEKDDIDCIKRSKAEVTVKPTAKRPDRKKNKDNKIFKELSKELNNAYKDARGDMNKKRQQVSIANCQKFLTKSQNELEALSKLELEVDKIKSLLPRKKITLIKKFMTYMTKVKTLFNEYKDISSALKDSSDVAICQPILKG